MGEHGHHKILGFDRYAFNFWVPMIFTYRSGCCCTYVLNEGYREYGCRRIHSRIGWNRQGRWHLCHLYASTGRPRQSGTTATALFPVFFIVVMVLFIGLTYPGAADTLPVVPP